ncbi:MAG: hypothetical protein IIX48_00535 [Lachnospiraceae bacterium]|nr:hypothetical protein [Lachnospiraceae bacterium]
MRRVLGGEMEYFRIREARFGYDRDSTKGREQLKKTADEPGQSLSFDDMLRSEMKFVSTI